MHQGVGEAIPLTKDRAQFAPVTAVPIQELVTLNRVLLDTYPILSPNVMVFSVISPFNHLEIRNHLKLRINFYDHMLEEADAT